MEEPTTPRSDVILIGAGVMSATLGVMLKELDPSLTIHIFERLERVAAESSDAWNNAGTGHAALCELNYTPERADGGVEIVKALKIHEQFEQSLQFWAWLTEQGRMPDPREFVNSVAHMSFVRGEENVASLRKRHAALAKHHLFDAMSFTEDHDTVARWAPLLIEGRDPTEPVAATRSELGTDVNFGALTRALFRQLNAMPGVELHLHHEVKDLVRRDNGEWAVTVLDRERGEEVEWTTPFVFIGAGGAALTLLGKSDIPEAAGYGGFPVGGQWLRCKDPEIVKRHHAKVYGRAAEGTPPMSVPHLDTRVIDGERALLFGPFAGFSMKFLKNGSWFDLVMSLETDNVVPMLEAGWRNRDLTEYLIEQVQLSHDERLEALRAFMPTAVSDDWELSNAGQRVQVIKDHPERGGTLEFGTEVVAASDGSLAALLGASPGASTAVAIMLDLIHRCMPDRVASPAWQAGLRRMVPSFGRSLGGDETLTREIRDWSHRVLGLRDR